MEETPQMNDFPSSSDTFQVNLPTLPLFTRSKAGILLENALHAINGFGDDAEKKFQGSLKELRELPEEVVLELAQAFDDRCQRDAYPVKWGLVYLATELKHSAAYSFLKRLIFTPIPEERSKNPHSFSTVAEETILRTTAVEGLLFFLKDRNGKPQKEATEVLMESLALPSISIARAAFQTLVKADLVDDKMKKRVRELLPKDRHFILKIKPTTVEKVEQIKDPESHLKPLRKGDKRREKPEAPRFDGDN
ncbi:hypothetical protein [Maribacter polysaccharolyticus]|uniref:hypothetical protein n=1 Tax=Maribacter polysaccharolyticus TaxID=3020831 RepID=UPI00237EF6C1|nr:hypothetical protein [Maribacter polysaccharolyticus]MDE3742513.1 hypothetical protein [Maribacter polysaccharolyticus]